jgi:hypothetical protein
MLFKKNKKDAVKQTLYTTKEYSELPEIPVERNASGTVMATRFHKERFQNMLVACRKQYGGRLLKIADKFAAKWMKKADLMGYEQELHDVAKEINGSGEYILNLSYEFACTSAVINEYDRKPAIYRAFDWPINNIGETLMILKREGKAGRYWDITFPGMVGVVHAMAPKRFAVSINRAPIPVSIKLPFWQSLTRPIDRWVQRVKTFKTGATPAPILLRKVFDECASYDEAVKMLTETKISAPTIFTICGTKEGQGCVIERGRNSAYVRTGHDAVTANHWQASELGKAHPRPIESHKRLQCMKDVQKAPQGMQNFNWAAAPLLNDMTRLVCELSPDKEMIKIAGTQGAEQVTKRSFLRLP